MTFFVLLKTIKLDQTASTFGHGIWGNLNLCFPAMVTKNGARINYLSFALR